MNAAATRRRTALLGLVAAVACDGLLTDPAPIGTVQVVTRTRDRTPLPGVAAQLYTGQRPMGYATTDTAGRIVWRGVPEGGYGVYLSLPDSYATLGALTGAPGGDVADRIPVTPASDTTVVFTLLWKGPGAVDASVVDEDGIPLAGMPVGLYAPSGVVGERVSDANGRALFPVVPYGNYGVFAVPPDSFGVRGAPWVVADGLLIDRGFVARPTLRLRRCTGGIVVTVRDGAGAPLPGFGVRRYAGARVWPAVLTGADGTVTIPRVICGEYGVYLEGQPGFTIPWARDTAFVDGIVVTQGVTRTATLRALRLP